MAENIIELPTVRGAVIKFSKDFDGDIHYGVAIADYFLLGGETADEEQELFWFIAGNPIPSSGADLLELLTSDEVNVEVLSS